MAIETVGVLGCGTMGSGISEVCARNGYRVIFRELDDDQVATGLARAFNKSVIASPSNDGP